MATARERARVLDAEDPLARFREEFIFPTRAQISGAASLAPPGATAEDGQQQNAAAPPPAPDVRATYLVGNSLGLQPRRTRGRVLRQLDVWATHGVTGHFTAIPASAAAPAAPPWVDVDAHAARMVAPIVGAADAAEVAVMQTLSANLHLLLCAFYRPDAQGRHEILLEDKAFPSDHFVVESQIRHHGLSPTTSLVALSARGSRQRPHILSTAGILAALDAHASTAAVLLLPGVQYYTGQLLDMAAITAHARGLGIVVIWDLAHAVGNVLLRLHDWNVDAAAWCGYKYLNGGPGCIAGMFLHERHHSTGAAAAAAAASSSADGPPLVSAQDRALRGWWGTAKQGRFAMDTSAWVPGRGAAAMQLSNPSVLCTTALCASLEIFHEAGGMGVLRAKSETLTGFLYTLLESVRRGRRRRGGANAGAGTLPFDVMTPADPGMRGAQLSILLQPGLLDGVVAALQARGVCVDERRPDVIRVAPAPLYNSFGDCCDFADALDGALAAAGWTGEDDGDGEQVLLRCKL